MKSFKILCLVKLFLLTHISFGQEAISNDVTPYYKHCSEVQNVQKRDLCTRALIQEFFLLNFKMPVRGNVDIEAGLIEVKFIINEKGRAGSPEIIKGLDEEVNERVIDLIYSLPKFIPGKKNGKTAALSYTFSINLFLK